MIASRQQKNTNVFHQRPDCKKQDHLESSVCPCQTCSLTLYLYQQCILRLHVVLKKIYNFPKKSELPTFIFPVKISWLIFFCGFWDGNEKFAEIRVGSLSRLAASQLDFMLMAMPHRLELEFSPALQREPARRLHSLWIGDFSGICVVLVSCTIYPLVEGKCTLPRSLVNKN